MRQSSLIEVGATLRNCAMGGVWWSIKLTLRGWVTLFFTLGTLVGKLTVLSPTLSPIIGEANAKLPSLQLWQTCASSAILLLKVSSVA